MKILGKTEHDYRGGYIVDMSSDEMREIMGFSYVDNKCPKVGIGDEIKVSEIFRKLRRLNENGDELKKIGKQLHEFASLLEPLDPVIKAKFDEATSSEGANAGAG